MHPEVAALVAEVAALRPDLERHGFTALAEWLQLAEGELGRSDAHGAKRIAQSTGGMGRPGDVVLPPALSARWERVHAKASRLWQEVEAMERAERRA